MLHQIITYTCIPAILLNLHLLLSTDCVFTTDFVYNNVLFGQTVRGSMIGGGGSINVILKGIDRTTTVNLSTYDAVNAPSNLTYRGILTAICLKPYL